MPWTSTRQSQKTEADTEASPEWGEDNTDLVLQTVFAQHGKQTGKPDVHHLYRKDGHCRYRVNYRKDGRIVNSYFIAL